MDEKLTISEVCRADGATFDVLFVHGLTGDPYDTWTSGAENAFWPKWLCEAFPNIAVYAVGYPSSMFVKWAKQEMDIHERANSLLEHLAAYGIGERPLAFVCHSLGGLLVKETLRVSKECTDEGWKKVSENARLVAFLATPHTGAALASAMKFLAPRLSSTHVDLLSNESGYLTSLNQSYRDLAAGRSIATVSYYEKHKTGGAAIVVTAQSADPGAGSLRPIAVEADHMSIAKPSGKDGIVYLSICRHLKKAIDGCAPLALSINGTAFGPSDYGAASNSDRRDLLQKLMDAGREHEYSQANDMQNKFAQRYYKHGLYTEARSKNDALLAEVEQRFRTHVYGAKICKNAPDAEIIDALQKDVIDTICVSGRSGERLSSTAVLEALYFLTEQCYMRWDVP